MRTRRLASTLAFVSVFTLTGVGVNLYSATSQSIRANAQTTSCDTSFHPEAFVRRVGSTTGINLRSDRRLDARTNENVAYNSMVEFEGWAYGQSVNDLWTGTPDALWYRLKNRPDRWIPSAYMVGYPPSNPPVQPPNCDNQPPLFPNPTSSNPLRGFRHPMNGIGNYSAIHSPPQQYADDLGVAIGTAVHAMRSGKVIEVRQDVPDMPATYNGGNNYPFTVNYILVEHDNDIRHQSGKPYRSLYLHLKQNSVVVKVGERVTAGQLIAKSGHNGASTAPHLHVDVSYPTGSLWYQRQTVPYVWNKPFDYNK